MLHPFAKQKIDWKQILDCKQEIIDKTNTKENFKRKYFDYKKHDLILILNKQGPKGRLQSITFIT